MPNKRQQPSRTRIIGGMWRGRKLPIAAGVRPTPNRARETAFNWLAASLPGARVLDLFAGSGALGFEALSRGAAHAVLVERNTATAQLLATQKQRLDAAADVVCADAMRWLRQAADARFDVAFLDPPFSSPLLAVALPLVLARLKPGGFAYLEAPPAQFQAALAGVGLTPLRDAAAGAVRFGLVQTPGLAAQAARSSAKVRST